MVDATDFSLINAIDNRDKKIKVSASLISVVMNIKKKKGFYIHYVR